MIINFAPVQLSWHQAAIFAVEALLPTLQLPHAAAMRRTATAAGLATTALASSLSSRGLRAASYVGTATRSREVPDKVSLAVAQNALMDDILLPRVAKAAAAASSQVRYAPSWLGAPAAREGFAQLYNEHILQTGRLDASQVAVVGSATAAIDLLLYATCERGAVVLTPAPYYGSYKRDAEARAECRLVGVPSEHGVPSEAQLEAAWTEDAKCLLLASPHNPCGTVFPADALRACVRWARHRGLQVVVDEVFALSVFDGTFTSVLDLLDDDDRHVHVVYSAAKDLALSGYRVGAIATRDASVLDAVASAGAFCAASTVTQAIVTELCTDDRWLRDEWIPALRSRLAESWHSARRCLETEGLPVVGEPAAGHFCLLDLRETRCDERALEAAGVVLTPGPLMGAPEGFYRLCHAAESSEVVAAAIARVGRVARGDS